MSTQLIKNMDLTYTVRMIRLLKKPFEDWTAYKLGIINGQGEVLRRPKTDEEKNAYTPFHASVRQIKKRLSNVPYMTGYMNFTSMYDNIRNRYNLTEQDHHDIMMNLPELKEVLSEEMVAGDAGGNPQKIAAGETSGAITNIAPKVLGKKKRKRFIK